MAYFYFVYLVFSLQHAACQHATNNMHVAAVFRNDIYLLHQWTLDNECEIVCSYPQYLSTLTLDSN